MTEFIYSVREVLSNVQCLPEESIAAQHTGDRPVYTKSKYSNSTAATITSDVLGFPQSWLLENLTELRKGDTRTVIIAVADEDRQSAEGGWRLATMEGCVMTIYPRALRKPEGLHQVSPDQIGNQGFEPWRTCLATVIIHELAHFLLHGKDHTVLLYLNASNVESCFTSADTTVNS